MHFDVLGAKLESRGKAGFKRCFQPVSEASADILRADQIELARPPLLRSEGLREFVGDLVQRQAVTFSVDAS